MARQRRQACNEIDSTMAGTTKPRKRAKNFEECRKGRAKESKRGRSTDSHSTETYKNRFVPIGHRLPVPYVNVQRKNRYSSANDENQDPQQGSLESGEEEHSEEDNQGSGQDSDEDIDNNNDENTSLDSQEDRYQQEQDETRSRMPRAPPQGSGGMRPPPPPPPISEREKALEKTVKELQDRERQYTDKNGNVQKLPVEMCDSIKETLREELWRTTKFVSSTVQQELITGKLYDILDVNPDVPQDQAVAEKELWVKMYGSVTLASLNKCRSYVIGRMRGMAMLFMDSAFAKNNNMKGALPNLEMMKSVILRQFDPRGKEAQDMACQQLFVWYVQKYLPMAAGNPKHWNMPKQCFSTISSSHFDGKPNSLHVPASTEAFALVVWEGYRDLWCHQWILKHANPEAVITPPRKTGNTPYTAEEKLLVAKCTVLDNGQKKYGGWDPKWVAKFAKYKIEIKERRQMAQSSECEEFAKRCLREFFDVTVETHAEWEAEKKSKRSRTEMEAPPEIAGLVGDEE